MLQLLNSKLFLFFVICLSFSFTQAYIISGKVLDSKTEQVLSNVNIYIENSDFGTITDIDGLFILYLDNHLEDSIHLNIKIIGYKEEIFHINLSKPKTDLGEVLLKNQSLELESVHIHSHKHESKQISDISLSGQTLNDNLTGNIATTLSSQPNIGMNSFGVVTSKPVLRGYSGDRFLLIKDGNKTGDLSQSSIDHIITLDMSEVNEIEVIRGPKSLVYGSNAIGGIINTSISGNPKARVDKLFKKIIFGGETFNKSTYGNVMLYIPIKNNQFNISLNNRNTENQTSPIGELQNTYSQTSNYKLGFTKYSTNSYINFIVENFNMDYGIPPSLEGHINGVDIELIKNTFQMNLHKDITFHNFNQFDIKYNLIDYGHTEIAVDGNGTVELYKMTNNIKIEIQSLNTILGAELDYRNFSSGGYYLTPNTDELDLSFYGFNETEFSNFSLLSSLRLSHLSVKPEEYNYNNLDQQIKNRNFNYFSSSIGIRKVLDKFELNSWVMNTMRAPKVEELFSDGPHLAAYSYEIGKPDLKLEEIYGIESSIFYNSNPWEVSLTAFYNHSPYYHQISKMGECPNISDWDGIPPHPCEGADFIEWGSGPGWLYIYQTKGVESLIKGLEFNLNYNYRNFKLMYDFSLVRGENLTNELPLSYINPDKQILILEYKEKLLNYKLRLSKIHSQNRLGEFESYTPSSFLVDFIIGYNRNNQNITIQLNNLFDEEYYNHLSKIKSIMPEAGRNVILNYKIFF